MSQEKAGILNEFDELNSMLIGLKYRNGRALIRFRTKKRGTYSFSFCALARTDGERVG